MDREFNQTIPGRYTVGSWRHLEARDAQTYLEQQIISTQRITLVRCVYRPDSNFPLHAHPQEQITIVEEGQLHVRIDQEDVCLKQGEMISIPARVQHSTRTPGRDRARAINLFVLPAAAAAAA